MKKKLVLTVVALLSVVGLSYGYSTITQSADDVELSLPRIEFYDQINDAVSSLTKTDVPALVTAVNELKTNATFTGTVSAEQVTSTDDALVTDDLTVLGDALVGGTFTTTNAPVFVAVTAAGTTVLDSITNAPSVVATNAPIWINFKVGATTYVVPAWAKP